MGKQNIYIEAGLKQIDIPVVHLQSCGTREHGVSQQMFCVVALALASNCLHINKGYCTRDLLCSTFRDPYTLSCSHGCSVLDRIWQPLVMSSILASMLHQTSPNPILLDNVPSVSNTCLSPDVPRLMCSPFHMFHQCSLGWWDVIVLYDREQIAFALLGRP